MILEVHGDWRTATRLYGSGARRAPRAARRPGRARRAAPGRRRADDLGVHDRPRPRGRASSRRPRFPRSWTSTPFLEPPVPLPEQPRALFVGVLERYKDVDGLAAAWRLAAPRLPGATLRIVGTGSRDASRRGARARPARLRPSGRRGARTTRSPALLDAVDVPRAARRARRAWADRRRGALPRASGRRDARRRDPRPRARRRERPPRRRRTTRPRSPTRSCACSRDRALAERLAAAARPSAELVAGDAGGLRAPDARARGAGGAVKPRVLFVGPTRYELPLWPGLARKWEAIGGVLDYRVLARGQGQRSALPARLQLLRRVAGPRAARVRRVPARRDRRRGSADRRSRPGRPDRRAGDRRGARQLAALDTALRLLGTAGAVARRRPPRRVRRPPRRRGARALRLHRRARRDGARPPAGRGLPHLQRPLRASRPPRSSRCPSGRRRSSSACSSRTRTSTASSRRGGGSRSGCRRPGSSSSARARAAPSSRASSQRASPSTTRSFRPSEVAAKLDEATVLVLPSRHEGLGRVVIEAFARGRGVVATRAGGILDLVDDGEQGLLVDPGDVGGLDDALVAVALEPRARRAARRPPPGPASPSGTRRPEQFAERLRALVDTVLH